MFITSADVHEAYGAERCTFEIEGASVAHRVIS